MLLKLLALAAASGPGVFACGELSFSAAGTMQLPGLPDQPVKLHVACLAGSDPFQIELIVPGAGERNDFDYADFEEPDARAAGVALSNVTWTTASSSASLSAAAVGSYDPRAAFAFHLKTEEWTSVLSALDAEPGTLVWTQSAFDDLNRRLVATFNLDAGVATNLRNSVELCLQMPVAAPWYPPMR
jgi:hypothetical protein